jgi:hypothetical protein
MRRLAGIGARDFHRGARHFETQPEAELDQACALDNHDRIFSPRAILTTPFGRAPSSGRA